MNHGKMKRYLSGFSLSVLVLMLYGCASANLSVVQAMAAKPASASLILIDNTGSKVSNEDIGNLKSAFSDSLQKAGVKIVSTENKDVAAIVGQIQQYDKGSKALRYFVGFGAGTGKMKTAWKVSDQTGGEIGSCNIDGSISMGVFGGDFYNVHEKAAEAFSQFFTGTK
ncbi:DUF4410 domain-containing protein [Methylomonas sp. MO1]|uniref:DUF4410 domain-containing protein n=2 Tax=unclassified Methylomonas TaxID=2608980 RepID=UPI0009DDF653|nr:DUF4410 domain-containing protein [Methylomonas sp. MO1]MDT4289586.1 DUF4410 domain-containing protein [Methylomonas sp. MO1]